MRMTTKKTLRDQTLAKRDALTIEYRIEAALMLASRVEQLSCNPGQIVSAFWPIRSEIDIRPLMFGLMEHGCQMALPAVLDRETIVFREYNRAAPLVEAGFGTMGPPESAPIVDPEVMLVPLAVFDNHGNRIGYGAGHYDRAIARLIKQGKQPRLIGVGFDCQRVDTVPVEPHDIPLNAIVTESALTACDIN